MSRTDRYSERESGQDRYRDIRTGRYRERYIKARSINRKRRTLDILLKHKDIVK